MKLASPLAEVDDSLYIESLRCFRCGLCRTGCPVFEVQRSEDWNTRGRILLIRGLVLKDIPPSQLLVDRLFSCTLCKKCEELCPSKVNVTQLICEARSRLADNGAPLLSSYRKQRESILSLGTITGRPPSPLSKLLGDVGWLTQCRSTVFHVGCVASYSYPLIARLALETLARHISLGTMGTEKCCGGVLQTIGYSKEFEKYAEENARLFEEKEVEEIVVLCPMCYNVFKSEYPWNIRVLHTSQVYEELLDIGKLAFTRRLDATVAYHDPCHLGRYAKLYDSPRKVLENIPGVKLVELECSRELSSCCGGPVRSSYTWVRDHLSDKIVRLADEAGASYLATACPTCFHNLYSASMLSDLQVKVVIIDELVGFAAGLVGEIPLYKP
ncbi:MAG: (Fe-S)-binding protein [Candidatus Freyarchaeota archaeon]|nr:(Fe-S)-binding protein [Candidatus Jordarchaeia archaeon]